jgi:hypothetical protein
MKSPSPVISSIFRLRTKPLKSRPLSGGERKSDRKSPPCFIPTRRVIPHTGPVPHGYTARRGGERGRFRVFEADAASWMCPAIRADTGFFQRERLPGFRARRRPGGIGSKAGSPRRAGLARISSDMARCPPRMPRPGSVAAAQMAGERCPDRPKGPKESQALIAKRAKHKRRNGALRAPCFIFLSRRPSRPGRPRRIGTVNRKCRDTRRLWAAGGLVLEIRAGRGRRGSFLAPAGRG